MTLPSEAPALPPKKKTYLPLGFYPKIQSTILYNKHNTPQENTASQLDNLTRGDDDNGNKELSQLD